MFLGRHTTSQQQLSYVFQIRSQVIGMVSSLSSVDLIRLMRLHTHALSVCLCLQNLKLETSILNYQNKRK